jgi:hypothetical protein
LGLTITLGAIIFSGQKALLFLSPILIIIVCIIYKSYATLLQLLSAAACILLIAFVAAPDNIGAQFNWAFERFSNGTDTVSLNAAQLSSSASSSTALIGNGLGLGSAQTRFLLPKGYFIFIETYQAKLIYEIGFFGTFFYYAMLLSLAVLLFIAIRNAQPQMRPYMIFCLLNFSYCSLMPFNYFDFDPTNIYIWLFMGIGLSLGAMPALDRGSPVTANRLGSQ